MECMFTAQGPSVLHAIEVAVVQFVQVHLVINIVLVSTCGNSTAYCLVTKPGSPPPPPPPPGGSLFSMLTTQNTRLTWKKPLNSWNGVSTKVSLLRTVVVHRRRRDSVKKGPFRYTADKSVKKFPLIPWHVNISLRTYRLYVNAQTYKATHIFSSAKITIIVSFMTSQRFWSFSSTPFILHSENSVQTKFEVKSSINSWVMVCDFLLECIYSQQLAFLKSQWL